MRCCFFSYQYDCKGQQFLQSIEYDFLRSVPQPPFDRSYYRAVRYSRRHPLSKLMEHYEREISKIHTRITTPIF